MKIYDDSKIEVTVNSRFRVGDHEGSFGVRFFVKINDTISPDFENAGSILTQNSREFLSIYAVFEDLPAGPHTVGIYARSAPDGSMARGVSMDPGGFGGAIIVKETW